MYIVLRGNVKIEQVNKLIAKQNSDYGGSAASRLTKIGTLTPEKTGTEVSRTVAKMMSAMIERNA